MRRELGDRYELDDDPGRIDIDAVHAFTSGESYWAQGRSRAEVERLVRGADRVREMVDAGPLADRTWLLHTRDMHRLYAKLGFGPPGERLMERPASRAR